MAIATYKIPILSAIRPNTRVGPPAYESPNLLFIEGTNRDYGYFAFEPAKDQDILIRCPVPDNYSGGTRQIRLRWRSTVNVGNVRWTVNHEPTSSGQIWDEAFTGGPDAVTAAAPGTSPQITEHIINFTGTAWGSGDDLWVHIQRTGTDGLDTMAANAELLSIDLLIEVPGADHGGLVGLADDDHPQYALLSGNAARNPITGTLMLDSAGFGLISADGNGAGIDLTLGYFTMPSAALGAVSGVGQLVIDTTTRSYRYHDGLAARVVANLDQAQTLTNKTLDGADVANALTLLAASTGVISADGVAAGIDMTSGHFVMPVTAGVIPLTAPGVIWLDSTARRFRVRDTLATQTLVTTAIAQTIIDKTLLNAVFSGSPKWTVTAVPSSLGRLGMDVATGRSGVYVEGAARNQALEVELGDGGTVTATAASVTITTAFGNGSHLYLMDATAATRDVALPDLATLVADRRCVLLQKADSSSNTVTLTPAGTDTIKGVNAAFTLTAQYELIGVQANKAGTDWVITHYINPGVLVRSDASGTNVIGTSGASEVLGVADTYETQAAHTDVLDYRQATWFPRVTVTGTATKLTLKVEWSMDATLDFGQGTEDVATSGLATVGTHEVEYDLTGRGAAPYNLEALSLPVIASNVQVSVKADIGTTTAVYIQVARQA